MGLRELTDRQAVISAMREYDSVGAETFYRKYGFGRALKFFVIYKGRHYDSKAIVAVAHRYQHGKPLRNTFSGGMATVVPVLRRLGFQIVGTQIDETTVRVTEEVPEDFWEGGKKQVTVNAYERNAKARAQCIEAHGAICAICGFDFGKVYGDDFAGYIHVHHRTSLANIGKNYQVDPTRDLVPVCPNCHAVLHHGQIVRTIDEVKKLIKRARKKTTLDHTHASRQDLGD